MIHSVSPLFTARSPEMELYLIDGISLQIGIATLTIIATIATYMIHQLWNIKVVSCHQSYALGSERLSNATLVKFGILFTAKRKSVVSIKSRLTSLPCHSIPSKPF